MKIGRVAEEKKVPEWIDNNKESSEYIKIKTADMHQIEDILDMSCDVSDDDVVEERDKIEKSASNNSHYYYNIQWPSNVRKELKEYAVVCGMDMSKFKAVNPSDYEDIHVVASNKKMVKTASVEVDEPKLTTFDAFRIDEKASNSYIKEEWSPEVKKSAKLTDRPKMGGIMSIRGGDNYFANPEPKTIRGQNSILDPNAIKDFAENSPEDNGAMLKKEKEQKEINKKITHEAWEQQKIDNMTERNILPNRNIFPTEFLNANEGDKSRMFDYSSLPDKTAGEQIKDVNEEIRKQKKHEFKVAKSSYRSISSDFSEELKKHLGQID